MKTFFPFTNKRNPLTLANIIMQFAQYWHSYSHFIAQSKNTFIEYICLQQLFEYIKWFL